jgi:hypothetical protein
MGWKRHKAGDMRTAKDRNGMDMTNSFHRSSLKAIRKIVALKESQSQRAIFPQLKSLSQQLQVLVSQPGRRKMTWLLLVQIVALEGVFQAPDNSGGYRMIQIRNVSSCSAI